ncbi:hypothetical protein RFI_20103 [Reticulomyxa filosa]|uniref:Uncharacterized protein n=1 Tax=Reticulomyxa filosa TaxID=46433 RepID=X6MUT7_RETFI|nr:hypothetical protein RFI_20103 [Reticulomyxa filosa]|eukprot:ETO17227.1 hypothetical protein RFI_20103 [Reticulomyxa filosa]
MEKLKQGIKLKDNESILNFKFVRQSFKLLKTFTGHSDNTIRFWDIKSNQQLKILNKHNDSANGIEFSSFSGGKYLCSGSSDRTIRLWDVETSKLLYVWCVNFSPLQNNKKSNSICVIGELDIIDESVRLWDSRSCQQIQIFNGHKGWVYTVEYSPFIINNNEIGDSSNMICSGSYDNTIRFWDIRSNKSELYVIKGDKEDNGIFCLKFVLLKNKRNPNNVTYDLSLCYSSANGPIRMWG